jgi:hypothetical protein
LLTLAVHIVDDADVLMALTPRAPAAEADEEPSLELRERARARRMIDAYFFW